MILHHSKNNHKIIIKYYHNIIIKDLNYLQNYLLILNNNHYPHIKPIKIISFMIKYSLIPIPNNKRKKNKKRSIKSNYSQEESKSSKIISKL